MTALAMAFFHTGSLTFNNFLGNGFEGDVLQFFPTGAVHLFIKPVKDKGQEASPFQCPIQQHNRRHDLPWFQQGPISLIFP